MSHPNREMTDLRARLRLPETREAEIRMVVEAYQSTGTVEGAAKRLRVSRETLTRCIKAYPELDRAIEAVRDARAVTVGPTR